MRRLLLRTGQVAAALGAPALATAGLVQLGNVQGHEYVFIYVGLVALIARVAGLVPSLLTAAASFLLVDWFFVSPKGTLTIADEQDIVNLVVFFGTAGLVGALTANRRRSLDQSQELARRLRQANAELVQRNREQAEAAAMELRLVKSQQQVRALQEREREQREVMANVSHDLRTPLGTILTASTGLLQRPDLDGDVRSRLETVAAEARRLNLLVENTLDLARIEAGVMRLEIEALSMREAADAAVERLRARSPGRAVNVHGEGEGMVMADWGRLGQVLDNLLGNADRHAPEGDAIEVNWSAVSPGHLRVAISDSGPGVPADMRDHLFERFARPPDSPEGNGTGLGLAIVRGLVEAHAGEVGYEDAPGGGARFSFTIPAAPAA